MEGLFLFQTGDKYLKELFERSDGQVLPAVIIDGHLFDLWVLFDQLTLLLLESSLALTLFTLSTLPSLTWFILVRAASSLWVFLIEAQQLIWRITTWAFRDVFTILLGICWVCLVKQVTTILTEVIREQEWLFRLHWVEHLNRIAYILNSERQIVWSLSLWASFLQDRQRVGENLGPVPDHVDNHEDHLCFTMRNLMEAKGW